MRILVLNAGSSSLKASVIDGLHEVPVAHLERSWGSDATLAADRGATVRAVIGELVTDPPVDGVGHRVVHGGPTFRDSVVIDEAVLAGLDAVADLAPLHNGVATDAIRTAMAVLPNVPHVACFDTAFHATLPEAAWRYPVPADWYASEGVRRYGFHGLSVRWAVKRAARLLERPSSDLALVVAHLGSGCSATATLDGRSVSTSMGMTPLEGLMMGTRSGSVDPGVLIRLLERGYLAVDGLSAALEHASGLLAVSQRSGEMRVIREAADDGDTHAALAIEMFARHAAEGIAAAATSLPRLDGLVFTGGIGEHDARTRGAIVGRLATLGFDARAVAAIQAMNGEGATDGSPAIAVVTAREDLVIAADTAALVKAAR